MKSVDPYIASGSGFASRGATPAVQHGAYRNGVLSMSAPIQSCAGSGTVDVFAGDTTASTSMHPPHSALPSSQLATSGTDAQSPSVVSGGCGATADSAATSSMTPMSSEAPAAARSGMYPSSRRQGAAAAAASSKARTTLPKGGADSATTSTAVGGAEDVNVESSASRVGYTYNSHHNSRYGSGAQSHQFTNSRTCGYYMSQGENPGPAGGSSASTSMPYASALGPMTGSSSSSCGGAGDGQPMPGFFFPCHSSTSATVSTEQFHSPHLTRYQQSQRLNTSSQHSSYVQQQQLQPYGPPMSDKDQGSRVFPVYGQPSYQPQQYPSQRPQQMRPLPPHIQPSYQSTLEEGQHPRFYSGNGADQRHCDVRTESSISTRTQSYNPHQHRPQRQYGYHPPPPPLPPSSGEGDTIHGQGRGAQSSIRGGTAEDYNQHYAPCPVYPCQMFPNSLQQQQQSQQQMHSSYMSREGPPSFLSASQGFAQLPANRVSQSCNAAASAYDESDTVQGSTTARYAGEVNGLPPNRGSAMYSSDGNGGGGHAYGATSGALSAGNGSAAVGSGSASGGYYGASYSSGYTPVSHSFRARGVPYTYGSSDISGAPFGRAAGKSFQPACRGSYPAPQQGGRSGMEGGSRSYHAYAASGFQGYHQTVENTMGNSGTGTGYGCSTGHAMRPQPPIPYQGPSVLEVPPASSAAASPPIFQRYRGNDDPQQLPQQQYPWGGSLCATDPRYGGVGGGTSLGCGVHAYASAYDPQHPFQQEQQRHRRNYGGSSPPQRRGDTESEGTSMHVSRYSQYAPQQPVASHRVQGASEDEGDYNRTEVLPWTQESANTALATSVRGRVHSRSSSSGNGPSDSGAGGSVAQTPSRRKKNKKVNIDTARTPSAANAGAAHGTLPCDSGPCEGGKRDAAVNPAAPGSARGGSWQTSPRKASTQMLDVALSPHEPLVSLVVQFPSNNSPRRGEPHPLNTHGGDIRAAAAGGSSKGEDDLVHAAHCHKLPNSGALAAVHDSTDSLLTAAEDEVDGEVNADRVTATLKGEIHGRASPTLTASQEECHSAEVSSNGGLRELQQNNSSTERCVPHANPIPHSSVSGNGVQKFLRRSPLTQCVGTPFHTYICGAIVEQAAQLQASASPKASRGTGAPAVCADTSPASLATTSSQVLPVSYAPVQRLLLRDASNGQCKMNEGADKKLARSFSDSGDGGSNHLCVCSEEGVGVPHTSAGADDVEAADNESTEGDLGTGPEGFGAQDVAQPGAAFLTADEPVYGSEAFDAAASPLRSGTASVDRSPRSVGGRPQHASLSAHHHSHYLRRSTPVSNVSSPSAPAPQRHQGYHGTSPFLQPAAIAVCRAPSPFPGGTDAANSCVQPAEKNASAVPPQRLPCGGGGHRIHLHGGCGRSREGSGAAATMQQCQQPPMVSHSQHHRRHTSLEQHDGRTDVMVEGSSKDAEETPLQSCQDNSSVSCSDLSVLQRQQQTPPSAGAGGGPSGGQVVPGGASPTASPTTAGYGALFLNTPGPNPTPFSIGPPARLGSVTPSLSGPPPPPHQQQRAVNSGGLSRGATSPPGSSQQGSAHGPAISANNIGGSGHQLTSSTLHHYAHSTHSSGYHVGCNQIDLQVGGSQPIAATRPPYIYEHHVGQELLLEEYHTSMPFSAASFGNIACLVDALSPRVPVASDLEFPCNEDLCPLLYPRGGRDLPSPHGGGSQHGSVQGSRSSHCGTFSAITNEDARLTSGAGPGSMIGGGRGQGGPAQLALPLAPMDRARYWDFTGPSYSEPVVTLKSIWQSFDNPFGCTVNLAEPIYPAPMRPAESELVYSPLLSGFRIRFHPASSAYKRLAALREVRRQRRREEEAAARGGACGLVEDEPATAAVEGVACSGDSSHAGTSYAEEDGVLTWSATDRPNNRNVIVEQIVELARCDESYAELLTATTADVDHQSWVALMWQPVFCGGHSSKHSCGTFLAYYLLRAPRHLFLPFSDKSEGAAMNSSWDSPVFRGDRAALSFDIWSLQRHYHIARWASAPPMTHRMPALSVAGEEDEPDSVSSSGASNSRGRNSWEEGQTGCTSNRTTASFAFSATGDSRLRLRDVDAGSTGLGAVGVPPYATPGNAGAGTCPPTAAAERCVRIPLVGLIPNRCRSEVWYKPLYAPSPMDMNRRGGGTENLMSGGDGAGPGAARGGAGMGASNGLGGAGGAGGLVGSNGGNNGYHPGFCAFHAPLFLLVAALQLMCWDAYNEWGRRSPTSAAATAQFSTPSEERGDVEGSDMTTVGSAGVVDTPSVAACTQAVPVAAETGTAAQRHHHQQQSGYESDSVAAPGFGNANWRQVGVARYSSSLPFYVAKGVELMTEAARQYRTMREVANLDAIVEESFGSGAVGMNGNGGSAAIATETGCNTAEDKRPTDGDRGVAKQSRGGGAVVAGGTNSALCDPSARVIAGLLDYYQWAQYDSSLTALATAYCSA